MNTEQKLALIKENLAEVLNPEIIDAVYAEGRDPVIYWLGTATTGRPHCGYFRPQTNSFVSAQFLEAGCHVKILLADIHGFLDSLKAPLPLVEARAQYYKYIITAMLEAVGVPTEKLEFVLGSSYQKTEKYVMDVYKLAALTSEHDAKKAGAEVVKQSDNAPLSGLLYPLLQVLDEEHLGVDIQFGGVDQRKLFTAAIEWLPKLGYKQRAHLLNPLIPGLGESGKMSSSDENSKIDLLDDEATVARKIKKALAVPKQPQGNALLAFTEYVLLPASGIGGRKKEFIVDRSRDNLEPLVYTDIKQMNDDYAADILTPQLLKQAVTKGLNDILEPIRKKFEADKDWKECDLRAYPPPEVVKKVKKVKNKGTGYPGAKKAEENAELPLREAGVQPTVNDPPSAPQAEA